jgi:hypothetical protein
MILEIRMVLAAPGPLLTPPPSSSPPKTPARSYSAEIRSQNEEKNHPPQTVPVPFFLTLPRTLSHMHTLLCSPQQPLANSCCDQDHWHHRIPKAKGRAPRININFRSLTLVQTCAETQHTHTHTHKNTHSLTLSLTQTHARTHTHTHACMHAYILTYVHPCINVCMYVFACVCVYVCSFPSVPVCALNDTAQRP